MLHLSGCTGVNTSPMWMEMEYGGSSMYVLSPLYPLLSFPFYSSKGRPRLHAWATK